MSGFSLKRLFASVMLVAVKLVIVVGLAGTNLMFPFPRKIFSQPSHGWAAGVFLMLR